MPLASSAASKCHLGPASLTSRASSRWMARMMPGVGGESGKARRLGSRFAERGMILAGCRLQSKSNQSHCDTSGYGRPVAASRRVGRSPNLKLGADRRARLVANLEVQNRCRRFRSLYARSLEPQLLSLRIEQPISVNGARFFAQRIVSCHPSLIAMNTCGDDDYQRAESIGRCRRRAGRLAIVDRADMSQRGRRRT